MSEDFFGLCGKNWQLVKNHQKYKKKQAVSDL
jgi:hypothetical protein